MTASLVYSFAVTVPAGTAQATPQLIDIAFPEAVVEQVDIMVPPGPSGLVGFQLWVKGGQVLPTNTGAWFIWDDRTGSFALADLPDSGAWQLAAYNTDIYDHTIYIDFQASPAAAAALAPAGVLDNSTMADVLAIGAG